MKDPLFPLRLLVGALATGVFLFAGVALWLRRTGAITADPIALLPMIAVVFTVLVVALRPALMRGIVAASARANARGGLRLAPGEDAAAAVFRGAHVAGAAVLEGAGLFCLLAYLLSGSATALAGGVAMPVLILLFHWPTRDRLEAFRRRHFADPPDGG